MQFQRCCFAIPVAMLNAGRGSNEQRGMWLVLFAEEDAWAGPCVCPVLPRSLLLKLVGFCQDCVGVCGCQGPTCIWADPDVHEVLPRSLLLQLVSFCCASFVVVGDVWAQYCPDLCC